MIKILSFINLMMWVSKVYQLEIVRIVCGFGAKLLLRISKSAKSVRKNPNLLCSNIRIFTHKASLLILRATKVPADDKQF